MRFVPLCLSCPDPVLRPFSVCGGLCPPPASPSLALGRLSPRGWARVPGAVWRPGARFGGGRQEALLGGGVWPAPCASPPGGVAVPG